LSEIAIVSKKIAKLLRENFGAESVNIVNNSGKDAHQIIFHLHFHVIPRYENDGLNLDFDGRVKNLNLEEIAKEIRGE
jgi:histidine triad (HIT) family protein